MTKIEKVVDVVCMCKDGHHKENGWTGSSGCFHGALPKKLPWERDGIKFCAFGHKDGESKWGMSTKNLIDVNMVNDVADFYLLDAIRWDVANPRPVVKKTLSAAIKFHLADKWRDCCDTRYGDKKHAPGCKGEQPKATMDDDQARDVLRMIAEYEQIPATMKTVQARAWIKHAALTVKAADYLRRYAHFAIAGELSHFGMTAKSFNVSNYSHIRGGWFRFVQHVGGAKAAKYAKEIFDYTGWSSSYGGKAWAAIADVLYHFESGQWEPWLFVDRMITLQHNTGSALNKANWQSDNRTGWHPASMNEKGGLLDAHATSDWKMLNLGASSGVRDLFKDYWTLANNDAANRGLPTVEYPDSEKLHRCQDTYCMNWTEGTHCAYHKPAEPVVCVLCCAVLVGKEIGHKDYGGKCESCAKTNNCDDCGKVIVPIKQFCDDCKKKQNAKATKPKKATKKASSTNNLSAEWTGGKIIGYSLTKPSTQPKAVTSKPKKAKFVPPTGGSLAEKIKQMQAEAMANMPEPTNDEEV